MIPRVDRRETVYADVPRETFADWRWQVRNRIDSLEGLEAVFDLTDDERAGFHAAAPLFRFAVTPYYALIADAEDPSCPIRRQIVPLPQESVVNIGERGDPLGEERLEAAPNLIHRYPDRALLLATDRCPVYCRFCTRRRIVGRTERQATRALVQDALEYIRNHDGIKEVIVSGGDALMLADAQLDYVLGALRQIAHVEIIRLATRMPVTCPTRITDRLIETIRQYGPIYVMTHFNHPKEQTDAAAEACARMVDAGLVVYNQSVLLAGVNDDADVIAQLNRRLVSMRVHPYYLHQCDLAEGIEHFRTPLAKGIDIIDQLRGHMSGLAVPQLCVDVPGGIGKVTVQPSWIVRRRGRAITFKTYTGETAEYFDPLDAGSVIEPEDVIDSLSIGD